LRKGAARAQRVLERNPEGKRLLPRPRPRHKWEEGIKINGKETELEGMDWIHLAEDRGQCEGCCEYDDEPSGSRK